MQNQSITHRDWLNNALKVPKFPISPPTLPRAGGVDLTSTVTAEMTMQVISAVAEFEKDLLIELTHSGWHR